MKGRVAKAEDRCQRPRSTCCCSSSRTRRTRRSTRPPPAPRSGKTPTATIDILVSGVGTGGTITGVSRHIKNTRAQGHPSVAVEPSASPVLTQKRNGEEPKPSPHKIQGIGAGFVPDVLDLSLVDAIEQVSNEEAIPRPPAHARRASSRHLLRRGGSGGGAPGAHRPENKGKTIVVILRTPASATSARSCSKVFRRQRPRPGAGNGDSGGPDVKPARSRRSRAPGGPSVARQRPDGP